jgi:NADH:ubiquinone oxidoreductase subunit F (NADH-binding)
MRARLFAAGNASLAAHTATFGPQPSSLGLVDQIRLSGLTGRGGSGFPTHLKLQAVADARRPVVVANGAEGEPASFKDATLLRRAPHLVLDGLALVAEAVGSRDTHLATTAASAGHLQPALAERRMRTPRVTTVADRFISGEESAVVAAIDGRTPLPNDRLRRVYEAGVGGRPTLVLNVETLAHIALIARRGADWFRDVGDPDDPGTFLATVHGASGAVVRELPRGVRLRDVLTSAGLPNAHGALVGGYHGAWLSEPALDAALSRRGLAPSGATPGAGIIVGLKPGQCALGETARILGYLSREVAGQCGPCINGLPALATQFRHLASGRGGDRSLDEVRRLVGLVPGRGACAHPDGTARLAASALTAFASDVTAHLAGGCDVALTRRLDAV